MPESHPNHDAPRADLSGAAPLPPSTPPIDTTPPEHHGEHPVAGAPPATAPAAAASHGGSTRRFGAGVLVAALAVGAVAGGASGAGIAWTISSNQPQQQNGDASPQNITINDTDNVNVVNAVAAKAGPSVVTISVSSDSGAGTGSGVILSDDGYVLTNAHVVTLDGATANGEIKVQTTDGALSSAEIVGVDPTVDLAVIQLTDASGLTPIEWADSDDLDVGDQVIAIGAPLGLSNTVTDGIVSALGRGIQIQSSAVPEEGTGDQEQEDPNQPPFNFDIPGQPNSGGGALISVPVIQTDAAINPGNSGGALLDDEGRLVGINVAIASTGGTSTQAGNIGVGFSIPSSVAQRVAEELIETGTASHGLLGATVLDAASQDGPVVGAYVDEVTPGGAADRAGLQPGDVVTQFNGVRIADQVDLTAQVRALAGGSEAELTYVRDGEETTVMVTLGDYQG